MNKIVVGIAAVFCAMSIFFAANVAKAGSSIRFDMTSCKTRPGKLIIIGYFSNQSNDPIRVEQMHFYGTFEGYAVDEIFQQGRNLTVGIVNPGDRRNWSFTINDNRFTTYNDRPRYRFEFDVKGRKVNNRY